MKSRNVAEANRKRCLNQHKSVKANHFYQTNFTVRILYRQRSVLIHLEEIHFTHLTSSTSLCLQRHRVSIILFSVILFIKVTEPKPEFTDCLPGEATAYRTKWGLSGPDISSFECNLIAVWTKPSQTMWEMENSKQSCCFPCKLSNKTVTDRSWRRGDHGLQQTGHSPRPCRDCWF